MDIASGLLFHLGHQVRRSGTAAAIAALVVATLALLGAAMIAGLPLSAPDVTTAAPLRWG